MSYFKIKSYAKINLALNVVGKKKTLHKIESIVSFIDLHDEILIKKINNEKLFNPKTLDFYNIQNEKICDLNLSKFNTDETKYTTLQRSTLIEFLKEDIYTQHLRFGKKIKEVSELKDKILIKFDDNTNDLVDFVFAADGIFSNTRSFFEKKKNEPKFKRAIAARVILKSKLGSGLLDWVTSAVMVCLQK